MVDSSVKFNHQDVEFHHGGKGREGGRERKPGRGNEDEDGVLPSDPFLFLFSNPIMKSACCYKKLDKPSILAGIYTLVSSKNFITFFSLSIFFSSLSLPFLSPFFSIFSLSLTHSTIYSEKMLPN